MFPESNEGKKSKKVQKSNTEGEDSSVPVDVLVDTIIGFLEKSTAYLRTTGNHVFSLLSSQVGESTVDLILSVGLSYNSRCNFDLSA